MDNKQCSKCIIKCLYQFVFKFDQFLDLKLTYLSNYWRFCDFDLIYLGKISAQSVKYKKTRNSRRLKNVTFLIYFFERNTLRPNSVPLDEQIRF